MADEDVSVLRRKLAEADVDRRELVELRGQLMSGERELARLPVLEAEVQNLQRQLVILEAERAREREEHAARTAALQEDLARAQAVLRALQSSPSWRVTRPLRSLKRALG